MNRLLLVEDNAALSRLLVWELAGLGYEVHLAPTFADALRQCDQLRFDFALLDCGLPDGCGPDLLERLQDEQPHIIPILMSGDPARYDRNCQTNSAVIPLLSKPFSLRQLQSIFGSGRSTAELCVS